MKLTWIWFTEKFTGIFYPIGIVPLILCTWVYPALLLAWIALGALGFVFGWKTWKYHVSKRDYWDKSEIERKDWKIRMAFRRLKAFCYTGATISCIILCIFTDFLSKL